MYYDSTTRSRDRRHSTALIHRAAATASNSILQVLNPISKRSVAGFGKASQSGSYAPPKLLQPFITSKISLLTFGP